MDRHKARRAPPLPKLGQRAAAYQLHQGVQPCKNCGANNKIYPSDDFPPYLTILVVGHVVVPLFVWSDHYGPPLWLQAAIWLPITLIACLALLPAMRGATVGLCWAMSLIRPRSVS